MNISIQVGNEWDNSNFFKFLTFLSRYTDYGINLVRYLAGVIGVILILPFLIVSATLLFWLTFILKWKLKSSIKSLYNEVNSLSQAELIENHLIFERVKIKLGNAPKSQPKKSLGLLFKPFFNQISQINHLFNQVEKTLKKAAYPDMGKPLPEEQIKELKEKFSDVNDWEDKSLDVYEKIYS